MSSTRKRSTLQTSAVRSHSMPNESQYTVKHIHEIIGSKDRRGVMSPNLRLQQENQLLEKENKAFRKYISILLENYDSLTWNVLSAALTMCDENVRTFISEQFGICATSDPVISPIYSDDDKKDLTNHRYDYSTENALHSYLSEQRSKNTALTKTYQRRTSSVSPDRSSSPLRSTQNPNRSYASESRSSVLHDSTRSHSSPKTMHFSEIKNRTVSVSPQTEDRQHTGQRPASLSPLQQLFTMKVPSNETPQHCSELRNTTNTSCNERMILMKGLGKDFQNHSSVRIRGVFDNRTQTSSPVIPSNASKRILDIYEDELQCDQTRQGITGFLHFCEDCGVKLIGMRHPEMPDQECARSSRDQHAIGNPVHSKDDSSSNRTSGINSHSIKEQNSYHSSQPKLGNSSAIGHKERRTFQNIQRNEQSTSKQRTVSSVRKTTNPNYSSKKNIDKKYSSLTESTAPKRTFSLTSVNRSTTTNVSRPLLSPRTDKVIATSESPYTQERTGIDSKFKAQQSDFDQTGTFAFAENKTVPSIMSPSSRIKQSPKTLRKSQTWEEMVGNPVATSTPRRSPRGTSFFIQAEITDDEELNESLADLMGLEGDNNFREQKALFVFQRPVDTVTGYQPKVTQDLKSFIANQRPNKRLVGELAFQLDRRIMEFVFHDLYHTDSRTRCPRYYGYSVANISQLIDKEAKHNDEQPRIELMLHTKLIQLLKVLNHFDYTFETHSEYTQEMVNKYGLLSDGIHKHDMRSEFGQPAVIRIMLAKVLKDEEELQNMLIIFDCLCFLSFQDKRPLLL